MGRRRTAKERPSAPAGRDVVTLGLVLSGAAAVIVVGQLAPAVPLLVVAVVAGAALRRVGRVAGAPAPAAATARVALRAGVVLMGLQLAVSDLLTLGVGGLVMATVLVAMAFAWTSWVGGRLGLPRSSAALVAGGVAVCGASAVAAVAVGTGAQDDEVASAIGVVTVLGTAAMVGYPVLGRVLGLSDDAFAVWVGGSVHEVAHVVATAEVRGAGALQLAILVKLARVVLLAPVVVVAGRGVVGGRQAALVPGFVVGFVVAACLRSAGLVPAVLLGPAAWMATAAFVVALVALGATMDFARLQGTGARPLVAGLAGTAAISVAALLAGTVLA